METQNTAAEMLALVGGGRKPLRKRCEKMRNSCNCSNLKLVRLLKASKFRLIIPVKLMCCFLMPERLLRVDWMFLSPEGTLSSFC